MRKLLGVLAVGVALALAPTVQAGGPVIVHADIGDSFTISGLCSFDVTVTISGTATIKLWLNDAGLVVREQDTAPGSTFTYASANGSFSFEGNLIAWSDYGSGAVLGSSADVRLSGLFGHVPGYIASDAGQLVFSNAEVIGFNDVEGASVPLTDGGDITKSTGHSNSGEDIDAAICAALS
jgi:hypothetical protein